MMMVPIYFLLIVLAARIDAQHKNNVCCTLEAYFQNISTNLDCWYDPDVDGTPQERAHNNGMFLEEHRVKTEDGYILDLFRLKPFGCDYGRREVIYLQHGLLTDCSVFMVNKENSIAFFLAKQGFDVWLGNFRGTEYSTHVKLTTNDPEYWDFSFHENGIMDVPANLEYINRKTKRKVIYIGYSMGATSMGVYASMKPREANEYVEHAIMNAGTYYMRHTKGTTRKEVVDSLLYGLAILLPRLNIHSLFQKGRYEMLAYQRFCFSSLDNLKLCIDVFEDLMGKSFFPLEPERIPLIFATFKAASVKQVKHYLQEIRTGIYQMFDYGPRENLIGYHMEVPPEYNLSDITISMSFIYGVNDHLATKEDTLYTYQRFHRPNWDIYEVPHSHFDYVFSKVARKTVLPLLLKIIKKHIK